MTAGPKVLCQVFFAPDFAKQSFGDEKKNFCVSCIQIKKNHFALEIATIGSYLTISAENTPPKLSALISQREPKH
ncbi:hypothetical protein LP7551_00097 [Roseibium album]|nr:hypothetical protein LP7551_00097 [Roseibium album]